MIFAMIKFAHSSSACAALILLGVGVTPLANAAYIFTDLGTLSGGCCSYANAINNVGGVAGWSYTAGNNTYHATVWNGATATELGTLTAKDLNTLPGGSFSIAYAINNNGQVAGASTTTGGTTHATLWASGTATDLGILGGNSGNTSGAYAINNNGQVAGSTYSPVNGAYHATLWSSGTITDLNTLGGIGGAAYAINNNNHVAVAGYTLTGPPNDASRATVWAGSTATSLGTFSGGGDSYAFAINNAGLVAGSTYTTGNTPHATLWNGTTITNLGALSGIGSVAYAINNNNQVVGYASISGGAAHAALWNGTNPAIDLNSLLGPSASSAGWILTAANGINDKGWIVGNDYNTRTGKHDGFLLSVVAVPEPETYAMLLAGLGLIGFIAYRRKNDSSNMLMAA
jgi:probable HAF family extracellular repeat protein